MSAWWHGLGKEGRDWFIITGFVVLTVVALTVAIVAGVSTAAVPALLPLMNIGIGTTLAGAIGAFSATMVRVA